MKMKNLLFSLSVIFLVFTSCKSVKEDLQITSITFDSIQVQVNVGESVTLTVKQSPANLPAPTYSWISLSPSIATVENGIVKGIGEGTTQIRVTSLSNQSLTDECTIVVKMLGTSDNPYLIKSIADLISMRDNINNNNEIYGNKSYKLMTDLDFINEQSWDPIGGYYSPFSGIFNGNGKTILNIRIGTLTTQVNTNGGLFGSVKGGEILNLGIHWSILNSTGSGSICANLEGGTITNCYSTGQITSGRLVGGIVGSLSNGTITNCYSSNSITANSFSSENTRNGGIAGMINNSVSGIGGLISNCIALNSSLISLSSGNSNYYPNRIADFTYAGTAINNFASISMVVQKGDLLGNLTTKTSFTDVKNDGLDLMDNPVDLLNIYVTTNPNYNGVKLNKWKVQPGVNNGNPIFQ